MGAQIHRRRLGRVVGLVSAAGVLAGTGGLLADPAFASQQQQQFTCDGGTTITILVADSQAESSWGVGRIVDGGSGHLIPTSFTMSAHDDTADRYLFEPQVTAKGGGNANHNQSQISCWQSQTGTLGDLVAEEGAPPGGLPGWASLDDMVTLTFTVTAVPRG